VNIRILQLLAGARQAEGLTVIIDVFRASTVGSYVFGNRAERILPVGKLEAAYEFKEQNPDFLLIGERKGQRPPNFDFGNSPTKSKR
jgi:2-phosphosulfolactate phosphatase